MAIPAKKTKLLKDLVRTTVNTMASLAPKDTGNLRSKIKSANTFSKVVERVNDDTINAEFTYEYAPRGAEYGKWFNDPPRVRSRRRQSLKITAERKGNWQYKDNTFKDPKVKDLTEKYVVESVSNYLSNMLSKL